MKETAVEWLVDELILEGFNVPKIFYDKAKAMEKEQIKNAWIATDNELQRIAAEEYYNRTYNKSINNKG
jgi:hypothetical protein